jgi:hypothetical protein
MNVTVRIVPIDHDTRLVTAARTMRSGPGATYEVARTVALLNQEPTTGGTGGARLLLGGTCVHNSIRYDLAITDDSNVDTIFS